MTERQISQQTLGGSETTTITISGATHARLKMLRAEMMFDLAKDGDASVLSLEDVIRISLNLNDHMRRALQAESSTPITLMGAAKEMKMTTKEVMARSI
jgi:hypothetical protein